MITIPLYQSDNIVITTVLCFSIELLTLAGIWQAEVKRPTTRLRCVLQDLFRSKFPEYGKQPPMKTRHFPLFEL